MPENQPGKNDCSEGAPVQNILLVEDNPGDVYLTRKAFERLSPSCHVHTVHTGDRALAFLRRQGAHTGAPRPDLIVLDINLPRMNGYEVLAELQSDPGLRDIPTVVVSSSDDEEDIRRAYSLHAYSYFVKPYDPDVYLMLGYAIIERVQNVGCKMRNGRQGSQ
jgi:CheY-like chemotaxis protein